MSTHVRQRRRHRRKRSFARRLATYSLAAGATFGAVREVRADLLSGWKSGTPFTLLADDLPRDVDINKDGFTDYVITVSEPHSNPPPLLEWASIEPLTVNSLKNAVFVDEDYNVNKFTHANDVLTSDLPKIWATDYADIYSYFYGGSLVFAQGSPGYIGLIFEVPGGSPYYGVMKTFVDADQGKLIVSEVGYQPVPEPGSLGLLAMGAAGLLAWRTVKSKKRQ